MKIKDYYKNKDGDTCFLVDSESYPRILRHLRKKKFNAGGRHTPEVDDSVIIVAESIKKVNRALADFDPEKN